MLDDKIIGPNSYGLFGQINQTYYFEVVNKESASALSFLNRAMQGEIPMKDFPLAQLDATQFNWVDGSDNRHWWWQLQQLPFLRWYLQSVSLVKELDDASIVLSFLMQAIQNWKAQVGVHMSESPLAWHDHAAALRLRNLIDFRVAICNQVDFIKFNELVDLLESLCLEHIDWLISPENYTRYTNHGFEQAESLYRCGVAFPLSPSIQRAKKVGVDRLSEELCFAFTDEGVHKENSPGYQKFMLSRLEQLSKLSDMSGSNDFPDISQLIKRASNVLIAMRMPDGTLPIIGDTRGGDRVKDGLRSKEAQENIIFDGIKVYDYSSSGYLIAEYVDDQSGVQGKVIFKCGHLSNYHRHDDDLSIYWQVGSECLVGDGGLYSHNEGDPIRKYLRSWHAHSCIGITGPTAYRRREELYRPPVLHIRNDPLRFIGISYMYPGVKARRVVNLSRVSEGIAIVEDRVSTLKDNIKMNVYTNWMASDAQSVYTSDYNTVVLNYPSGGCLEARMYNVDSQQSLVDNCMLIFGNGHCNKMSGLVSRSFNVVEPCWRILSYWPHLVRRRTIMKWHGDSAGVGEI